MYSFVACEFLARLRKLIVPMASLAICLAMFSTAACGGPSGASKVAPTPNPTAVVTQESDEQAEEEELEEPEETTEAQEAVDRLYGKFVRSELLVEKPEAAAKFYARLLGWTIALDSKTAEPTYIVENEGVEIARIRKHDPASTMPAGWMSWISVEDIDDMLRDIPANDGIVLEKPKSVELGRAAVIKGPTDGVFGIIQLKGQADPDLSSGPGDFVLSQLWTDSFDDALAFYSVIGDYTTKGVTYDKTKYVILLGEGVPRALIRLAPPGKANRWIPFVLSKEIDKLTASAKKLGAAVLVAPRSIPLLGRLAVVEVPAGGILGFITPSEAALEESD